MRRADRLFQIVQHLRGGRLVTAARLAERLEVSERTIYRDIADLQSTGVPIDGEAGVGYVMRGGFELPPLMFSRDEIVALVAGARMVRAWGGVEMARAAEEALVKIEAVLPTSVRKGALEPKIFAPPHEISDGVRVLIDDVERAVEARDVLSFGYRDERGTETERAVHPLGLWYWGKTWTLIAWCELRADFRMFRLDRMMGVARAGRRYEPSPERSLATCLRRLEMGEFRRDVPGGGFSARDCAGEG